MHIDSSALYPAIPVIIILVAAEAAFQMKERIHEKKDILTSFIIVLGRIPFSAATNGFILLLYTLIYRYRIFAFPDYSWFTWVICFFGDDLSFYWFHRCSHKVRFLWASHQVHHSSENFTLSSGLRVPWTSNLTGNFLFWAWMPFIGIDSYMVIFAKSVSSIYQFWLHTETIKKLPRCIEAFFSTPSHHRVHHGSNIEYLDKNHGGTIIIWDKMFGTYREETIKPTYGLRSDFDSCNAVKIILSEWIKIGNDLKKTKNFSLRLKYLFNPPGWSPDGSSATTKQLQSELKHPPSLKHHPPSIINLKKFYEKEYTVV
ncbi:MAG: sterol desaturase family protein [Ginsengibacter sp.]